jgi:aryl-alcohol dehydrogenase-like predicted oxidoreductase
MYACMEHGINYVDACSAAEVAVYAEAVRGRREEIYMGFDWTMARAPEIAGSLEKLKAGLEEGLKKSGLDYADLWRITLREQTTQNSLREIENVMAALEWGKKTGKARFTGIATHHRPWIADAVAKYPQIEVVVTPYSAGSNEKPVGSMFDALRKHDIGMIGIKPFASGSLFASRGTPDSPTKAEDDPRARMALRHALCCDVLSAGIPGLITVDQVKNAAAAVRERRQFDVAEAAHYRQLAATMWQNLPPSYQWLRDWEWV